jgi:hypothetical protein
VIFPNLLNRNYLRRISSGDFSALTESVQALEKEIKSAQREARQAEARTAHSTVREAD